MTGKTELSASKQRTHTEISAVALFRPRVLAVDVEMTCDTGRSGVRLSATNADGVVSWSNHRIAVLADHAQIALLQLEMNFLARTRIEVNSLKSSKSDEGCTLYRRKL